MSRAALLALLLALAGPVRAQDDEPVTPAGEDDGDGEAEGANGSFTFDDAEEPGGGVLSFDDDDALVPGCRCGSCGPSGPEALAQGLRDLVARKRASQAADAEWYAASLLPAPTSPSF